VSLGVSWLLQVQELQVVTSTCVVETENAVWLPAVVHVTSGEGAKPGSPSQEPLW
jgi:hypothetical protein